jgi:3-oxoadipate enol-lactonase
MKRVVLLFACLALSQATPYARSTDSYRPFHPDSGSIAVDGGRLFYEAAGAGETIVLLHDGILHRVVWDGQFPVLAEKYRVVRYDRRGFGNSSMPEAPFSHLDDLNQLFLRLKIDKAVIFGMSAGGGLAIDFALKYPERVSALVLVGAVVSGFGFSRHFLTRGGHLTSLADIMEPAKFIQYFGWDDPYEIFPENIEAKKELFRLLQENPQNVKGALGYFSKGPDRPAVGSLSEIKVPVLVLVGEFDIPDVHAHAGVIQSGIPGAKREIIPKSGHLIPLERPEAFNASVLRFLGGMEFFDMLNTRGVDAAVRYFHERRAADPGAVPFEEGEMNTLGYRYLQDGRVKEAIELFKLNTIAYPRSGNAYDSLGEAYLKDGRRKLAIENYEKALELNPNNSNARQVLKDLNASK